MEHLISTPGIEVNIKDKVSWYIDQVINDMYGAEHYPVYGW